MYSNISCTVPVTKYFGATWSIFSLVYVGLRWGKPEGRKVACYASLLAVLQVVLIAMVDSSNDSSVGV